MASSGIGPQNRMSTKLKYGENPHQKATAKSRETDDALALAKFKREDGSPFVGEGTSWISITDLGRLLQVVERFASAYRKNIGSALPNFAAIVKHGSPCGAAFGKDSESVVQNAWRGDPQAAFGGFLITTFAFTKKVADALKTANAGKTPFLSVAAPSLESEIERYLSFKASTRYFIANPALAKISGKIAAYHEVKSVRDMLLEQTSAQFVPVFSKTEYHGPVFSQKDLQEITADLSLAYALCSASTSNTVTLVKNGVLIGNATGQQKRAGSVNLALQHAKDNGHDSAGAVAVSDSYFPFPDGVEALAEGGVRAIFATSGSVRDKEVFAKAEELGIGMFTVPDKVGRMFAGH